MPKRSKLPEPELHALIVEETRYRLGCEDFAPDFTLGKRGQQGLGSGWRSCELGSQGDTRRRKVGSGLRASVP